MDTGPTVAYASRRRYAIPHVIRDGLWSFWINIGSKASVFVQIAIAARAGGPAGLGAYSQVVAAAVLISSLCDFGFSTEATRYAASAARRVNLRTVWLLMRWRMLGAAALTAAAVLYFCVKRGDVNVLTIASASLYSSALIAVAVGVGIANGLGIFRFTGIALGLARLSSIPFFALTLLMASPNSALIACAAITEVAAACLIWYKVRRTAARCIEPISVQTIDQRRAVQFGGASSINILINQSDTFFLSAALPLAALGAYATASQIENAVTTIALVPASALMVHIARATPDGDSDSRRALRGTATAVALLSLAMAIVLAAAAPIWIPVILGEAMTASIVPVRIVLIGATLSCLAGVTLMALSGLGRGRSVLIVWLTTAALSIPIMYILSKLYGETGAAVGALIRDGILLTSAVVAAVHAGVIRKEGNMRHYVYSQTTRAGLANELFPVIRGILCALDGGFVELKPIWMRPRIGPLIRGERDKRRYHRLFRRPGALNLTVRALVLLAGQRFDESGRKIRHGLPGLCVTVVKGMDGHFEPFRGRHHLVLSKLESLSRDNDRRQLNAGVAMHVRLGDFARKANSEVISSNESTPMQWFVDVAVAITESGWAVTVFSDGEDSELSTLLAIPCVTRAPDGTALSDLIAMSGYVFIVGSGSTFTAWAAFVGDRPLLLFPGTNRYLKWSDKVVEESDGTRGVSQIRSMLSRPEAIIGSDE